jgi:hypothetical protein
MLALALAASTSRLMYASTLTDTPDCSASGDSLKCHLLGILDFLYVAAVVLGIVLIVVVVLAVNSYRKNKKDDEQAGQ